MGRVSLTLRVGSAHMLRCSEWLSSPLKEISRSASSLNSFFLGLSELGNVPIHRVLDIVRAIEPGMGSGEEKRSLIEAWTYIDDSNLWRHVDVVYSVN